MIASLTGDRIQQLLSAELLPRSRVAPSLAYGRHRGPAPGDARVAAVAIAIYQESDRKWTIPLTLRPNSLQHHGGQVCLPGGQVEADEDVYGAALREFEEELGVHPRVLHRCGELSTQYVYASDNLVHPVVVVIDPPAQPWRPDPVEVERVITLPLDVLMDQAVRTELIQHRSVRLAEQEIDQFAFRAPAFRHREHTIWGATALILDQLAQILHGLR